VQFLIRKSEGVCKLDAAGRLETGLDTAFVLWLLVVMALVKTKGCSLDSKHLCTANVQSLCSNTHASIKWTSLQEKHQTQPKTLCSEVTER